MKINNEILEEIEKIMDLYSNVLKEQKSIQMELKKGIKEDSIYISSLYLEKNNKTRTKMSKEDVKNYIDDLEEELKDIEEFEEYEDDVLEIKEKLKNVKGSYDWLLFLFLYITVKFNIYRIKQEKKLNDYLKEVFKESLNISAYNLFLSGLFVEKDILKSYNNILKLKNNLKRLDWLNKVRINKYNRSFEKMRKDLIRNINVWLFRDKEAKNLIKIIDNSFSKSDKYLEIIAQTETVGIKSLAEINFYNDIGIKKYQLLAVLDKRTSAICQEMNLNVYDFDKVEIGINYPPFHPRCRTIAVPYFGEYTNDKRVGETKGGIKIKVPKNMSYKEFKEKFL